MRCRRFCAHCREIDVHQRVRDHDDHVPEWADRDLHPENRERPRLGLDEFKDQIDPDADRVQQQDSPERRESIASDQLLDSPKAGPGVLQTGGGKEEVSPRQRVRNQSGGEVRIATPAGPSGAVRTCPARRQTLSRSTEATGPGGLPASLAAPLPATASCRTCHRPAM